MALSFLGKIVLSPHIGDLETLESLEYFEKTIETFKRLYRVTPDEIICDKHPYYESSKWARSQPIGVRELQHHYAHALSVMFENQLKGEYLTFCFDGTGYGDDGTIWGGEVLIASYAGYERIHHVKPFKLIGNEKGIKNPQNTAYSLLSEKHKKRLPHYRLLENLHTAPFPLTSSMGRVFDSVAFLGGFITTNAYEGYSGLRIEAYYDESIETFIEISFEMDFGEICDFAYENRGNLRLIASVFLNSLVELMISMSRAYDKEVIVSGGVFQNRTLLSRFITRSAKKVYFNKQIPINDGGISMGQIAYALYKR